MATAITPSIADQLPRLRASAPGAGRVLSAYLDTSPLRADRNAYLLAFRDCCKQLRAALEPGELKRFERAVVQAERYLTDTFQASRVGLAIFASGSDEYFFALPLPRRVRDEAAWGERPLLGQLDELLDDCERIVVVLFDKERARILSLYLGEIEESRTLRDEVPGRQATGGWFGLAQSRYARHHEDHVLRHAKHAIRELTELLRARPFDRLLIGGPDEAVEVLRRHLPRPLRARLAGALAVELFASDADVLGAALRAAEEIERREEAATIEELLDAATSTHTALGLREVLDALHDQRIHTLFIADSFSAEGGECSQCGRLVPGPEQCPICGTPTRRLGDLKERIVELATGQGARTELVSGQAASLLTAAGGLGAWTRY